MAADNASIVRTMLEAFNERDLERGAAFVAPDAEFVDVPSGSRARGPEGYKQDMQRWLTAFPDGKVEITNLVSAGDTVVVEYTGRGTNTGPLMTPAGEIPPTGKAGQLALCDISQLKDGKIVAGRSYYDVATLLGQLGLMPEVPVATHA
jgi:steroid delta-isomerase-like uncharacterized protein